MDNRAQATDAVDPLTGIAIGCRTFPLDPGSPAVFNATVRMADTTPYLGHRCGNYNGGAGLTEEEARNAALGEAIERYCASVVRKETLQFGSWRELQDRANLLHPSEVALYADFQSATLPWTPFGEDTPLAWLTGESLVERQPKLVPACLVHIPYRPSRTDEAMIGPAISTGLACGPSLAAALLSGLYESIERDAFTIVWLNQLSAPRLILDEAWMQELLTARFLRPNLEYFVFVLQLDIPVPTVICLIRDTNFDPPLLCIGGACRGEIRQAVLKALIEAVQGWNWARHERLEHGTFPPVDQFDHIRTFESRVRLYACADMSAAVAFLLEAKEEISLSAWPPNEERPDPAIETLVGQIAAAGSDVVAIDMTAPEFSGSDWQTAKVFCPGLQQVEGDHLHRLLGGRRWRDVPVKMGLGATPLDPADLNPFPHPYP
jgi:ribosomal protein S12 methylthiotransferase accessory factor